MSSGDAVHTFERALAERLGQEHAVSVTYARLGLRFLLEALGVRAGDEVIVSGLTCRVVVLAIQSAGIRPIYADLLSSGGLNMDASSVSERLTPRSRAIVFQHTYGMSAGLDAIAELARQRGIPLIEDCAHCLPAATGTQVAGTRGIASIWSHNFRKPMPVGAGGSVATSDAELAHAVRNLRDQGATRSVAGEALWYVTHVAHATVLRPSTYWTLWSLNRWLRGDHESRPLAQAIRAEVTSLPMRISERQAEWGLRGLSSLERRISHASDLAAMYGSALRNLTTVRSVPGVTDPPRYYYPILAREKPVLLEMARRRRRELIAWPLSTPIYPIERVTELRQCDYEPGSCPAAEERAAALCGLPLDLATHQRSARDLIDLLNAFDSENGP